MITAVENRGAHPRHHCKPSCAFQTEPSRANTFVLARFSPTRVRRRLLLDGATQNAGGALQLRPAVAALAGVEDACAAAFQTVLRPLLRLLLLGQHVAPVRCTVERQHRFDSQQRGLRTRCRHWSTCRRYKLVSVVAFQPVLLPLLSSLLLRQHVALLHWTVERGDKLTVRFTAAWAQVALPWRQWGQQSRLTRANHEISILPGSSLRHTKSQSLPLVSCRDATCSQSHCLHLTWLGTAPHPLGSPAEHVRWLILRVCDPKNQLKMRHGPCRPEKFSPAAPRKMRLSTSKCVLTFMMGARLRSVISCIEVRNS